MAKLWISETFVNATEGHRFGESRPYETDHETTGALYRAMSAEYGRCISAIYIDQTDKPPKRVGWVFRKRMRYEDARTKRPEDFYIREVWVTVHSAPPETVYHVADLDNLAKEPTP